MYRRISNSVLAVGLFLGMGIAAQADEIVLISNATYKAPGGRIRGQITAESPSEVKIKPAVGADQSVPVDQISSVTYDGAGQTYGQAEIKESAGQFSEAAELYKKAAAENSAKKFIAASAKYHRANILTDIALASPTKAKDAIIELEAYAASYPDGRNLGAALESLIRLQLLSGDSAKAQDTLKKIKEKLPNYSDRVGILEAKILAKSGKIGEAIAALDKAIASGKGTSKAREAKLAKAEALVADKKYDEALATVQEVIKESPPEATEIQAVAHNTLGDCYRAAGKPKDALMAYLHTDILFDKDKEEHPRALAMIEQLFRELKVDARADEVHDKLKQLYPQSPYLNRATR